MSEVILLYDSDCPNVDHCRANLIKAFVASGKKPLWREIDRSSDDAPPRLNGYGSPTILVNGLDVAGQEPNGERASCRLYQNDEGGYVGVPPVEQIAALLSGRFPTDGLGIAQRSRSPGWKQTLALLPAIGVALLPSITCPACWSGYAAVLSSFGIGFLPSNRYMLPLTVAFLVVYLLILSWDARRSHHYGPLMVGTLGSIVLVVSRFVLEWNLLLYAGVAVLITASVWNAWPTLSTKWFSLQQGKKVCSACQSAVLVDLTEKSKKSLTQDLSTDCIL